MVSTTTMASGDLNAILGRLRELARTTASTAPPPPAIPPPPSVTPAAQYPPQRQAAVSSPPNSMSHLSSMLTSLVNSNLTSTTTPPPAAVPAPASEPAAIANVDVASLYQSLVAAGIVQGSPNTEASTSKTESKPEENSVKLDPKIARMREYKRNILSLSVSLTNQGLQKYVERLIL